MKYVGNILDPELEHNQSEFRHLTRRKRQVAVASVLALIPVLIFVPGRAIPETLIGVYAVAIAGMAYYEWRRFVVFRRDLKERNQKE